MEMIQVRAVPPLRVARVENGHARSDRPVGYGPDGEILPDGESVPRIAHYLRAIRRGELEMLAAEAS